MADVFDKAKRSEIMSHIRSKNTKPEVVLRKALFAEGFRYRINDKHLAGKPDIVLPKYRAVIFVQGCFWHGHEGCRYSNTPKSNVEYWSRKILNNKRRDAEVQLLLKEEGWNVFVIWECSIKSKARLMALLPDLCKKIRELSNEPPVSISTLD